MPRYDRSMCCPVDSPLSCCTATELYRRVILLPDPRSPIKKTFRFDWMNRVKLWSSINTSLTNAGVSVVACSYSNGFRYRLTSSLHMQRLEPSRDSGSHSVRQFAQCSL